MVYHTSWCPYCKFPLEIHNSKRHSKIDSEFLPCPKCRKLYRTGKKLWEQMDENEQTDYYIVEYFKTVVSAFILSLFFTTFVFNTLLKFDINWMTFIISCLIVFPVLILSTKKALKVEIETTFEEALLKHWKQYVPNCDSLFKEANEHIMSKYNCTFFELEKNKLPPNLYNANRYNQINERVTFLLEVLDNNTILKDEEYENSDNQTDEKTKISDEVLNILSDKDRIKNIIDGKEKIDENLFLGIENPYNGNKIETKEDIMQYLHSFYLSYSEDSTENYDINTKN